MTSLRDLQPAFESTFTRAQTMQVAERLWQRDIHVFGQTDETALQSIRTRLGWLDAPYQFEKKLAEIEQFAKEVVDRGFTSTVLLGMGGSSLCVEVIREVLGIKAGFPVLHVLDSTHPDQIAELEAQLDLARTLFIVASKSGTTIESDSFYRYFWDKIAEVDRDHPGNHFIAITDPNTFLSKHSAEQMFLKTFENPSDIGGRFSALSYFGLVPAALMGVNMKKFMSRALEEANSSKESTLDNPALTLGVALAAAHEEGRNKVFITSSKQYQSFVYWAEQLVAESTGKLGKGVLPVDATAALDVNDGFTVSLVYGEETPAASQVPGQEIRLRDEYDLAAQFFRWEFATAVCGALLQINPFDEPNVTESKNNTSRVLTDLETLGSLPTLDAASIQEIKDFAKERVAETGYFAILAYVARNAASIEKLNALRDEIRNAINRPVTVGFGPRYLHSTGQLHKGGAKQGAFAIIIDEPQANVAIPTKAFNFNQLVRAQAIGDSQALASKDLPVKVFTL
ncbi:MAG TPA: glucose-6-phosphate isomerase [Candidatus Kapabacteria bacterium]|nr:glucose-6-phosphate isomerase [Candidatus Kapabacteria bacterium]